MNKKGFLYRVYDLYADGFRSMKLGRTLWAIILIKLFVIFVILKLFFFPNFIKEHAEQGQESEFVATQILNMER
jgi:tellurite resistance protein TehA-like permease